jgi:hypothetical protein
LGNGSWVRFYDFDGINFYALMKKINFKTLWNFSRALSLAFLFAFLFFVSARGVSASATYTDLTSNSDTVVVPSHTADSILFCQVVFTYNPSGRTATFNGVAMTLLGVFGGGFDYNPDQQSNVYYLVNPPTGSYTFAMNSTASLYNWGSCILVDYVKTSNFPLATSTSATVGGSPDFTFNVANAGKDYLFFNSLQYYTGGAGSFTSASSTVIGSNISSSGGNIIAHNHNDISGMVSDKISSNGINPKSKAMMLELDDNLVPPGCTSHTYGNLGVCDIDGIQTRDVITSTPSGCSGGLQPTLWQTCTYAPEYDIYDAQSVEGLYFRFDNIINYCRTDMSCKLNYSFDTNIFGSAATGTLYYFASSTASSVNLGTINLNTQGSLGIYGSGNLTATSSASSTVFSYYSVVPHSDIYNQNYATTTVAFFFMDPTTFDQTFTDPWNAAATANMLGLNTHDLACTAAQWASTSSIPFLGVNVDVMMCNTRMWLLDTGLTPMQWFINKVNLARDNLMGIFPFNIIKKMQTSWQAATAFLKPTPCYAADGNFSTSTGVYSGDFSITANNLFGAGTGSTTISFLSKANLINLYGTQGFNIFNLICRLLVWAAFLVYCWDLITNRLHTEMTN